MLRDKDAREKEPREALQAPSLRRRSVAERAALAAGARSRARARKPARSRHAKRRFRHPRQPRRPDAGTRGGAAASRRRRRACRVVSRRRAARAAGASLSLAAAPRRPPLTAQRTPREPLPRPDLPSRIEAGAGSIGRLSARAAGDAFPADLAAAPTDGAEAARRLVPSAGGAAPPAGQRAPRPTSPAIGAGRRRRRAPEASAPFPGAGEDRPRGRRRGGHADACRARRRPPTELVGSVKSVASTVWISRLRTRWPGCSGAGPDGRCSAHRLGLVFSCRDRRARVSRAVPALPPRGWRSGGRRGASGRSVRPSPRNSHRCRRRAGRARPRFSK